MIDLSGNALYSGVLHFTIHLILGGYIAKDFATSDEVGVHKNKREKIK